MGATEEWRPPPSLEFTITVFGGVPKSLDSTGFFDALLAGVLKISAIFEFLQLPNNVG